MPLDLGNHNMVADALVGWSRYPNLTVEEYFDQFFKDAKQVNANLMILSAEHFFGDSPRIWDVPDEQTYFELYRRKFEALERHLVGHEVTLIVYLRFQVNWLAKVISQTVRTERLITGDDVIYHEDHQFYEMAKPMLRYCTLIEIWANSLQPHEVMVIPYERKLLHKNSSIADFLYRARLEGLDLSCTRLLMLDYGVRAFLRKHAKPVHSVLHQLKRAYRAHIYRK